MEDEDWSFFCNNSPRLISKENSIKFKLNPKLQGLLSKINLAYSDRSNPTQIKQPVQTPTSCIKPKGKSLSRPIKKVSPAIPRMLFSREDILHKIPSQKYPRSKSPTKKNSK